MQSYKQNRTQVPGVPRAKRSLGQNFLHDANIARKIVRCLDIGPEDNVLEIGPGQGALTGHLCDLSPARLVLVEKDRHWAAERMRQGGATVILADALTMAWERFQAGWRFVGNLPYNVASPLMWDICSRTPGLVKAVFMVQKEVGMRVTAKPGTSAYGALSVWLQSFMLPKLEFVVPPQVFRPRPKVDSAVLSFIPLPPAEVEQPVMTDAFKAGLATALKAGFQMRRKQMGSIVRAFGYGAEVLADLGIEARQRPEDLAPAAFHLLARKGIFTVKH